MVAGDGCVVTLKLTAFVLYLQVDDVQPRGRGGGDALPPQLPLLLPLSRRQYRVQQLLRLAPDLHNGLG